MTGRLVFRNRTIAVLNPARDRDGDWRLVHVNSAKFDKGFLRRAAAYNLYIGRGGGDYWLERLARMDEMKPPIVHVDVNGGVGFEDGRHRYAALRECWSRQGPSHYECCIAGEC